VVHLKLDVVLCLFTPHQFYRELTDGDLRLAICFVRARGAPKVSLQSFKNKTYLSTMDLLVLATMKNAAKCENVV
jgi:hypothetical protein